MNAVVKARVESNLKAQADQTFRDMGMDMSAGIKMFLTQVVMRQALPFDVKVVHPNKVTVQAIEDAYAGNVEQFDSVEAMFADAER